MKKIFSIVILAAILVLVRTSAYAEPLQGSIGQASGSKWQSSYMDLDSPRDFKRGERLSIKLQGTAEWVRVRLLPQDGNPDQPTGLIGEKMRVPPGGELKVTLITDHTKVKQVSVHAGKEAFGKLLGTKNGETQIVSIHVSRR